jgi:tRNA (cytidine56-2'-O)-methyltransferase
MEVKVLRLDHRRVRDARISTHVCLSSRAFGASGVYIDGDHDKEMIKNVQDVVKRWGGKFQIEYVNHWKKLVDNWEGKIIHLTMYGEQVQKVVPHIQADEENLLVIVGGPRVPKEVYQKADWNVAVTNQPHSEVSALAVFLHMLFNGKEFELEFEDSEIKVLPSQDYKKVVMD